eukprot:c10484_g1_i2.p2 GENE.c10484_g1_i2~~c10484_g1_i2.p2  ORF type:complete len:108 (-),score=17.46 c10484_g1_i2:96-419(-)
MGDILGAGMLFLEETYAQQTDAHRRKFDSWKARLMDAVPGGFTFEGLPINFTHSDAKKIRRHMLEKYDYYKEEAPGTKIVVAIKVIPYPAAITSIWVYLGKLYPNPK